MSEIIFTFILVGFCLTVYFIITGEKEKERKAEEEERQRVEEARRAREEAEKQARIAAMSPERRKAYEFEERLKKSYYDWECLEFFRRAGSIIYTKDFAKRRGIKISEADSLLRCYGTYIEEKSYDVTSTGKRKTVTVGAYRIMPEEEFYKRHNFKYPA